MNRKKAIGFGILLWMIIFMFVSVLIAFKLNYENIWMELLVAFVGGLISFILAGYVKPGKASQALAYGLSWAVIALILDFLVTTRFNPDIFGYWTMWLGYVLVLLAPLLKVKKAAGTIPNPMQTTM